MAPVLTLHAQTLGKGRNGVIHEATFEKQPVAVKLIQEEDENEGKFSSVIPPSFYKELIAFRALGSSHPNIVHFYDSIFMNYSFSCKPKYGLVLEKCQTNLRNFILSREVEFSWKEIKFLLKQILEAVSHCHSHHIWHQDLSSSNVLCKYPEDEKQPNPLLLPTLKLTDFGMSIFQIAGSRPRPFEPVKCPTFESHLTTGWYRAPELFECSMRLVYTNKIDLWSVGCIFAEILTKGNVLFQTKGGSDREQKERYYTFKDQQKDSQLSLTKIEAFIPRLKENQKASDLFFRLLEESPEKRISSQEALRHPFFCEKEEEEEEENREFFNKAFAVGR